MKEKIISKAFGSVMLSPRSSGNCMITPPNSPYFEPKKCRITCVDPNNPTKNLDLKIGAALVGGSPQLAINKLIPDETSEGLRPDDIDYVNWSTFSTVGLARELQVCLYNPNEIQAAVFICIDGFEVGSLDEFSDDPKDWREQAEARHQKFKNAEHLSGQWNESGWQSLAGNEVELDPLEQRIIKVIPTVSPYFDPHRVRFHGHRMDDGASVPFSVIDAFCGGHVLYGTMVEELFEQKTLRRQQPISESPQQLIRRLEKMVDTLTRYGRSGLEMLEDRQRPALEDSRGMLTSHLVDKTGWGDASWWPICSTHGLRKELGIVAHNPWPFRIRASVSLDGCAVSDLCERRSSNTSKDDNQSVENLGK